LGAIGPEEKFSDFSIAGEAAASSLPEGIELAPDQVRFLAEKVKICFSSWDRFYETLISSENLSEKTSGHNDARTPPRCHRSTSMLPIMVARFFLVKFTNTGTIYLMAIKYIKWP
jgi:hypothetical protein